MNPRKTKKASQLKEDVHSTNLNLWPLQYIESQKVMDVYIGWVITEVCLYADDVILSLSGPVEVSTFQQNLVTNVYSVHLPWTHSFPD